MGLRDSASGLAASGSAPFLVPARKYQRRLCAVHL